MKYRFYGNTLQLLHYKLKVDEKLIMEASTEEEKSEILAHYPNAVIEEIDNIGCEWLDGMVFTQEQLRNGELDKAIEIGEEAYMALKNAPSQDEINAMLMLEIAKLKVGANNG